VKPIRFVGSSLDDLKNFPAEARRDAEFERYAVQRSLMPSDFKPLPQIGQGAYEIRIHALSEWRVVYVAKFDDAVYVLHAPFAGDAVPFVHRIRSGKLLMRIAALRCRRCPAG
jgi:phage-related protein